MAGMNGITGMKKDDYGGLGRLQMTRDDWDDHAWLG